jgi:hypothetical protein
MIKTPSERLLEQILAEQRKTNEILERLAGVFVGPDLVQSLDLSGDVSPEDVVNLLGARSMAAKDRPA